MSHPYMMSSQHDKHKKDLHVDLVLDWLNRAMIEKDKKKNEDVATLSWGTIQQLQKTTWLLGIFQVVLIILFATVAGSEILDGKTAPGTGTQGYNMFIGVEVMMFVGFGYLMTFLKWYGLGAVGLTMMVTAAGLQWSLFTESFFNQILNNTHDWHYVDINIYSLLNALYAISAVLISFGALIGKISPLQLLTMTIIELLLHSVNFQILMLGVLKLTDMGGTYVDHMFGAYFGLAVSLMLGRPSTEPEMGNSPDIFSLVGTVFLWIYWPSFVAGAAEADSLQQQRAIVNTILALSGSTICAFWMSSLMSNTKRFRPVDIQNATLAGGVAIGCTANLALSPFGAIMIGCAAGLVSTFGFQVIQPYLEAKIGLHDTCGVHNLHAMPSVVGALASVVLAAYKQASNHDSAVYGEAFEGAWWRQLAGIVLCISFAVITGSITGIILVYVGAERNTGSSYCCNLVKAESVEKEMETMTNAKTIDIGDKPFDYKSFHDDSWWEVADDYGRSLYSELSLLISENEDKNKVKELVASKISDWSSHSGRRNMKVITDTSGHGPEGAMKRESSNGRLFAPLNGNFTREGSISRMFIGSSHGERDRASNDSPNPGLTEAKKSVGKNQKSLPLTKIVEKDLEGQDYIPDGRI